MMAGCERVAKAGRLPTRSGLSPHEAVFVRTTARFRAVDRFTRFYVGFKLRGDPVNFDLLTLGVAEPLGRVADLGCGRGQLAIALLEGGVAASVDGRDYAESSVARARRAASGLNFLGRAQDLSTDPSVPPCDTALLIDILYLLGRPAALALLQAAAAAATRLVVVRTHDPLLGWRGRLTVAAERVVRPLLWNTGKRVDPISPGFVVAALEEAGFAVTMAPCRRGTPYANVLLVGRRVRPLDVD
jgi:SAM-dependent methyltransferase